MARMSPKSRSSARSAYQKAKSAPLGSGDRFKAVEAEAAAGGASDPAAVAAAVGRKKYGAKKMAALSKAGRKK